MIDRLLKLAAPHRCVVCEAVGDIVCSACEYDLTASQPSVCYRCNRLTQQMKTCRSCRSSSPLFAVHAAADYDGPAKQLVLRAKYQSAREAAYIMGNIIDVMLPQLPIDLVVPIPTTPQRIRERGYNQAKLIATTMAAQRRLRAEDLLVRTTKTHQVGADMITRRKQLHGTLRLLAYPLEGKTILLIDDVISTGASLEAAADSLKSAGAKRIYAAVFARNI